MAIWQRHVKTKVWLPPEKKVEATSATRLPRERTNFRQQIRLWTGYFLKRSAILALSYR